MYPKALLWARMAKVHLPSRNVLLCPHVHYLCQGSLTHYLITKNVFMRVRKRRANVRSFIKIGGYGGST